MTPYGNKQSYCTPYHSDYKGDVEGCGKQVNWQEIVDPKYGKKRKKFNMDGSEHVCPGGVKMGGNRVAEMEPQEYRELTGPTQADKVASQGLKEANANSFLKSYFDNNLLNIIKDALTQVMEDFRVKTSADNMTTMNVAKNMNDLEKKVEKSTEDILKAIDEVAIPLNTKGDKIDAFLAVHSFKGANEMYHTPVSDTTTMHEERSLENEEL